MRRMVRAFLLWVMVLAMPVQGMAASVMQFCGPSQARMVQGLIAVGPAAVPMSAHAHATERPNGHFHEPVHEHAASGHELPVPPEPSAGPIAADPGFAPDDGGVLAAPHGQFGCSACAACGSMPALLAVVTLPAPPGLAQPLLTFPSLLVQFHLPGGLDRPPRAALA